MKPTRYEIAHQIKTPRGPLTVFAVIEQYMGCEAQWLGTILGRPAGRAIEAQDTMIVAPTADDARKQLAAALRTIADEMDQTQIP